MDKQIKYLLGLLVLIIISAYFLSLFTGLPQFFKDDIIAFLEERISGEISFSSVSLWPLNRIRLNEFEYKDNTGDLFKADSLNLDYSLNFSGEEEIFKIEFIELVSAEIEVGEELLNRFTGNSELDLNGEENQIESNIFSQLILPDFIADLNLNIVDSKLIFKTKNIDFELNNLQLGLKAEAVDNYTANLSTAVLVNNLEFEKSFKLSGVDFNNLDLQFERNQNEAEVYFKSDSFDLKPLLKNLNKRKYSYQGFDLDLDRLSGSAALKAEIEFEDSEITKYNSELSLKDINFETEYNYSQNQKEKLNLSIPSLNLTAVGPDLEFAFAQSRFFIGENLINFGFKYNQDQSYQLQAEAQDFLLNYEFLNPYLEQGSLDFQLDLEGNQAEILNAAAIIESDNLKSSFVDLDSSRVDLRLTGRELFLEEAEFLLSDGGQLNLKGSYNLNQENYLLKAEADNFKFADTLKKFRENENFELEDDYYTYLDEIKNDRLSFLIDAAGVYGKNTALSAAGDINLDFELSDADNQLGVDSSFWYAQDKLMLNSFKLDSDFGYLDMMGEVDLAAETFNLRYAAKNLDLKILNNIYGFDTAYLDQINPTIEYAEGSILDNFNNPTVNLRLKMEKFEYQDYTLENINFKGSYQNDNLIIKEFKAGFDQAFIKVSGEVRDLSAAQDSILDLNFKSENLYFQDLVQLTGGNIPITGQLQLDAALSGRISDYNLDFQLSAVNSILELEGREFELSNLKAAVKKEDSEFILEGFSVEQQNLKLSAAGIYSLEKGFDINYQLSGFELNQYLADYTDAAENLSGSLELSGDLKGELENAVFNFSIDADNLAFDNIKLEFVDNSFQYVLAENKIVIELFDLKVDTGTYRMSGEVFDLNSLIKTDLKLELVEVPTQALAEKFTDYYPLAEDMILSGNAEISSAGSDYSAQIDIKGNFSEREEAEFILSGNIGRLLNIDFEASELMLDMTSIQYDINLNLKSRLNFRGSLEGSINSPVIRFSHNLIEPSINNTKLESLNGEILVESSRRFSASETIEFREGGNLKVDGSYSILEDQLNLSSNLNSLPLGFLFSFFGDSITADGELNGNFRAEGSLESPAVGGQLDINAESLEVGLSDPIRNFSGQIELSQGKAIINNAEGQFVDGNFNIDGDIDLFNSENTWNLTLKGENLYFNHGSLEGLFDTELQFAGPLLNPLLSGNIKTYDFVIGIPFKWPTAETGDSAFVPRIDLDVLPAENVRVIMENPQMQIPIESGSLNVVFDSALEDALRMEGRFRTTEGAFSYYNSRFLLDNAEVIFTPVDENDIPTLRASATTYAGGREINISINGPADNMRISFSSVPEMSEEEILNLLSSRGALGSAIIGGEDIGIQQIILQELVRILSSFLQEDIISDLESDFKTALSLDRIEIDTYQFGLEREFAIYLGKNITDRLYLEYATFFREGEREGEISFQYKLTDLTVFKGTYFGDDEYQISIETGIDF